MQFPYCPLDSALLKNTTPIQTLLSYSNGMSHWVKAEGVQAIVDNYSYLIDISPRPLYPSE